MEVTAIRKWEVVRLILGILLLFLVLGVWTSLWIPPLSIPMLRR